MLVLFVMRRASHELPNRPSSHKKLGTFVTKLIISLKTNTLTKSKAQHNTKPNQYGI